jgi:hypothetical protein
VVVALAVACGTSDNADDAASTTAAPTSASSTTSEPVEDFVAQPENFVNLHDMTPVRQMFIANGLGHLDEALAVANNPEGGVYPVGTIIQLVPQEAMVKRAPGFAPENGDWEFFNLNVSPEGTEIVNRGGAEILNRFGNTSCADCHGQADVNFDFVCEKDHGCDPLPIPDTVFLGLQEADPRPRQDADTSTTGPGTSGPAATDATTTAPPS